MLNPEVPEFVPTASTAATTALSAAKDSVPSSSDGVQPDSIRSNGIPVPSSPAGGFSGEDAKNWTEVS